ncbi:MAG: Rab family GTPase [Candidatus Hodarchaeales archaeon]|jgi:small GTP-binding protein
MMSRAKLDFAEGIFRKNFKVCVIGDGGVGKTALIQHLLGRTFTTNYLLTIGTDISTFQLQHNGQTLRLQLWDLAGQSRFDIIRNMYFSGARAGVLVFDLTRPASLQSLSKWKDEIFLHSQRKIPIVILGNKSDLEEAHFSYHDTVENFRSELEREYDEAYESNELFVPFHSTSAQTGKNVLKAFDSLGEVLLVYQKQSKPSLGIPPEEP